LLEVRHREIGTVMRSIGRNLGHNTSIKQGQVFRVNDKGCKGETLFLPPGLWNHQFSGQGEIPVRCSQIQYFANIAGKPNIKLIIMTDTKKCVIFAVACRNAWFLH